MRFPPCPRRARIRVLAAAVLAAGCAGRASLDELPSRDLEGHYTAGPGASWFIPCGAAADSAWWATFVDLAVAQRDSLRQAGVFRDGDTTFVRVRGAVTTSGEVGPAGRTAVLVRDIVEAGAGGSCR